MQLQLKYAATPANAPRFAGDVTISASRVSGLNLDYTPDSLTLVDTIFDGFRADSVTSDQIAETLFSFGCYVGEVLTRHAGGRWRETAEDEQSVVGWPMVVDLGSQRWCNPIGKAFKRLENGQENSLRHFYTVFAPGSRG
jgi:hypothetical protein